jgi:peptidoglycan/xylan/chitin deacetylase (PgdA/CDA1 family)
MTRHLNARSLALSGLCGLPGRRRLVILTYHRVLNEADPLLPDEPTAALFQQQLTWVSEFLNVLPLPEAVTLLANGELPARAACITFDDGYRNNYEIALPILERLRLPATFFIATGAVADGAMWNDLIIESIRSSHERFDLSRFGLGVYPIDAEGQRAKAVGQVLDAMKYLPVDQRAEQSRQIYREYRGDEGPSLMMTPDMIRSLASKGFDVGGHTVSHPILERVADSRAEAEIQGCRDWLTSVTGRAPVTFAYPNGRPGSDFSVKHCAMVRDAGFQCAVSTTWGCASPSSDVMALPRVTPWETTRAGYFSRLMKTYVQSYQPAVKDAG